jgi:uncharacterized protein YyaL (SSP411 family)
MTSRLCRRIAIAAAAAACAGLSACDQKQQPPAKSAAATSQQSVTTQAAAAATTTTQELLGDATTAPTTQRRANRLANEKSPYLQQHAHNPVDWYPWGDEAFAKAKKENKPIFLSVGYSTCHWCHVMEREAFSDEGIARLLNENFVPVKVDREERPDVDRVYMTFVTGSTGSGGWPMTVFLTPDLKPVLGGTYFPIEDARGQRGLRPTLERVAEMWKEDPKQFTDVADSIAQQLRDFTTVKADPAAVVERALLDKGFAAYRERFDAERGGFGQPPRFAPKFPSPVELNFLLHHFHRAGEAEARDMVLKTLGGMAAGGIRDHLGGGFHRYSTDARWFLPHFEKMLYDQAQLAGVYLDAYQVTGDARHADIAREVFEYVLRDMTSPDGAFYSAEDADSVVDPAKPHDKAEGAFYVWTLAEVEQALGPTDAAGLFAFHYGLREEGNVDPDADPHKEFVGKNVLAAEHTLKDTARQFGKPEADVARVLAEGRRKLLAARDQRPRPFKDDKVMVGWNGLMISAFARGGPILNEPRYTAAAARAAGFVRDKLYDPETRELARIYREGASGKGFLEDYAFYVESLIDLYESTLDVQWLKLALDLQATQDKLFGDPEAGGYFSSGAEDASLLVRMKDDSDGVEPSGNSVAARNLLRLGQMTDDRAMLDRAERTIKLYAGNLQKAPAAMPRMLVAIDLHLEDKTRQIVIAGDPAAEDTKKMLATVFRPFMPNRVILGIDGGPGQAFLGERLEFVRSMTAAGGKATAYVCKNRVCDQPTSDPAKLERLLAPAPPAPAAPQP